VLRSIVFRKRSIHNTEEKLFISNTFLQHSLGRKCCNIVNRERSGSTVPCKATIYNIVTKLRSAGSLVDKKKSQTEELDICTRLGASPKKSPYCFILQCVLPKVQLMLLWSSYSYCLKKLQIWVVFCVGIAKQGFDAVGGPEIGFILMRHCTL
jgi:hypothetical protein